MPRRTYKISYVKKPLAKKSLIAAALAAAAVFLCFFALRLSITAQGKAGLNAGAAAFCSLLVSLFSAGYAGLSFLEKEKNYILSRISILLSLVLVLFWIGLIITAWKG